MTTATRADFQAEKAVVRAYYDALSTATPDTVHSVLAAHLAPEICGAVIIRFTNNPGQKLLPKPSGPHF